MELDSKYYKWRIANKFGLLDNSLAQLVPQALRTFAENFYSTADLIRNVPGSLWRTDSSMSPELPEEYLINYIYPLVLAADFALGRLKNEDQVKNWIFGQNHHFYWSTPFEACMAGKGRRVIEYLLEYPDLVADIQSQPPELTIS